MKKYDNVRGWWGVGTITDIAEGDDLVRIKVGSKGIWTPRRDIKETLGDQ